MTSRLTLSRHNHFIRVYHIRFHRINQMTLMYRKVLHRYIITDFHIFSVTPSFEIHRWLKLICYVLQGIMLQKNHLTLCNLVSGTNTIALYKYNLNNNFFAKYQFLNSSTKEKHTIKPFILFYKTNKHVHLTTHVIQTIIF